MTPELKTRLAAHVGADASASDDDLLALVADELDATGEDIGKAAENAKLVTQLSADNERLTKELEAKDKQVLSLSANASSKPDPTVVAMFAETLDAKAEQAIEAGIPQAAVNYFAGLVRDSEGQPNVLALSACSVPAADNKSKPSRLGTAIIDGLCKLAKGGFGEGVATGFAAKGKNVLMANADAKSDADKEQEAIKKAASNYVASHYPEPVKA